jgi:CheY-like chemotaxis protein
MAKLLLVDDDTPTLTWMSAALRSRGHEIASFTSPKAALAALPHLAPDLIIADILIPEMDGLVFARLVRRHHVPVMFVSIAKKEAEAVLVGATGYVRKPASAPEIRAAVERILGSPKGRARILVADDDVLVLQLYEAYLASRFDVIAVENGAQALEALQRHSVDLAIVDVHMPVMNGAELIKAMRADPRWERTPVIVETTDSTALDAPLWSTLRVARVMDKTTFASWLDDILRTPVVTEESETPPSPPRTRRRRSHALHR